MFEAKQKQPVLSKEIEDLVVRSTGEIFNGKTDEILRYKYKVMQILIQDMDLLSVLHCADLEKKGLTNHGDSYRGVSIFDFMKLPDLKSDVKNYICFDVVESFGSNNVKRLVFRTVCHESDMNTDWGVSRMDLLAAIIKSKFDWSHILGFTLRKESDTSEIVGEYYYREVSYISFAPNNTWNRVNHARSF